MISGIATYVLYVVFLLTILDTTTQADCDVGWFGPNCQYKSHCKDGNYTDGSCKSQICDPWWWGGHKCQYALLVLKDFIKVSSENPSINIEHWNDMDDHTCILDRTITRVTINLNNKFPFLFIKLAVADAALIYKFNLVFEESCGNLVKRTPCQRQAFTVDNKAVVIQCENPGTYYRVILEGEGVTSLCSIYLPLGRNVALKQLVDQTSTNDSNYASNANDGSSIGNCSLTNNGTDSPQTWVLTFDEPVVVSSFHVISKAIYFDGSTLQTFDKNGINLFNRSLYGADIFFENINTIPVQKVKVTATTKYYPTVLLNLCEVFIYGACPTGKWGFDCKQQCDSKCPDFCSEWDGTCPTGCLGFQAPDCIIECPIDKWGINCTEDCSDKCQHKHCNSADGLCTAGCNGYSDPPYCTKPCEVGSNGRSCRGYPYSEQSSFSGSSFGIGFGVCVAVVVLIVVAVLVFVGYTRKRNTEKNRNNGYVNNEGGETQPTTRTMAPTTQTVQITDSYNTIDAEYNNWEDYQQPQYNKPI